MRKILMIAIVLMAMMWPAAATDIGLYNVGGPYDLLNQVVTMNLYPDGVTWTQKDIGTVFDPLDAGSTHTLNDTITPTNGGNANDISIEYHESGNARASDPYVWTQDAGTFEIIPVYFQAKAGVPNGNTYLITIDDTDSATPPYTAELTVTATMVPEFPTIALPVAAILGLAFIFQRRREED